MIADENGREGEMDWHQARHLFETNLLPAVAEAYGTTLESLGLFPHSEGCQNLVYAYDDGGASKILRVSFRTDRPVAQIASELDFVTYLADHGAGVAAAVPSVQGARLEQFEAEHVRFTAVAFLRGKGMRVPDNGYRYREGVPISEYFRNWGAMLGRLHRLSKTYVPGPDIARRPDLLEILDFEPVEARVPADLPRVRERLAALLAELRALPRDPEGYGLIHADFNDGNFTVDYATGEMTVFDFDDCCHGWFMYELAAAWSK